MKCKQISIAFGLDGNLINKIRHSWKILKEDFNINYISKNNCQPHISLHSGSIKKTDLRELAIKLKMLKLRKFKINSPGTGIFISRKPIIFLRWETNSFIRIYRQLIKTETKKFFIKKYFYTNDNLWIPRSTIAYKDTSYANLESILNRLNFLFKKHTAEINSILLIDYSKNKEKILNKIKLI
jgi:2'-5' RNA ligase